MNAVYFGVYYISVVCIYQGKETLLSFIMSRRYTAYMVNLQLILASLIGQVVHVALGCPGIVIFKSHTNVRRFV